LGERIKGGKLKSRRFFKSRLNAVLSLGAIIAKPEHQVGGPINDEY